MIGSSIVALVVLFNVANASPSPMTSAMHPSVVPTVTPSLWLPSVKLPHIGLPHFSMPKFRLPRRAKSDNAGDPMQVMARRLTSMVGDQEAWYSDHGQYSTNSYSVGRNRTRADTAVDKVQVQMLFAGKKGWTAIASHPDAPGKSCVIYVGYKSSLPMVPRTRFDATDATLEGKPACDK